MTRIELALSAWEADVLPLNYTRERLRRYTNAAAAELVELPQIVPSFMAWSIHGMTSSSIVSREVVAS